MAELTPRVRLQPSLLDRLTDDEPTQQQESREKRVLAPDKIRQSVLRDLSWLLNTVQLESVQDLSEYPYVAESVLNFGIPDLAGRTASSINRAELEEQLLTAIKRFEPRLLPGSLKVKLTVDADHEGHNVMTLTIHSELWSQPIPLRLYMRTQLDLESGEAKVSEIGSE